MTIKDLIKKFDFENKFTKGLFMSTSALPNNR